jgi:hypothetical protein
MNFNVISAIIIIAIIFLVYVLIKTNKNIRIKAYEYFLKAEHEISATGEEKMQYVIDNIYSYLPTIIRIFVSPELLEKIVQKMFDEIKDLLDDGKINKSTKGE